MSNHELRSSTKWSAIRSKAVPSNVLHPRSDSALNISADAMPIDRMDKPEKLEKTSKAIRAKSVLPAKLHKRPTFAGNTGSSHV